MILRGLTLWRPWAASIVHGPKRVENRPWFPAGSLLAQDLWIAIHAGKTWDREGAALIRSIWPEARATIPHGTEHGIVGVAHVVRWGSPDGGPWAFGPCCWYLEDVLALPAPIPCRGAQGPWNLPRELQDALAPLCLERRTP